jgi:hypothetical protein
VHAFGRSLLEIFSFLQQISSSDKTGCLAAILAKIEIGNARYFNKKQR